MSIYRYAEDDEKANEVEKDEGNTSTDYQPPETHDESIDALPKYEPPEIDRDQAQPDDSDYSKDFDSNEGGEK